MRARYAIIGVFGVIISLVLFARAQVVFLDQPTFLTSTNIRLVVNGPTTNIRYDVYFTNALSSNAGAWPLLISGATNQVIFDFTMPDPNGGFFLVTSNYVATTNPPPKVATPVFDPASASGNDPVLVSVTCDTPGAVIYYTTDGTTPTTSDEYLGGGGELFIDCMTTLKAVGFRSGFEDSDVASGTYSVNCPPVVFAGYQQVTSGSQVTLTGVSSDDGLTTTLSNYWRKISGPGTVTFGNANATNTTATMSQDGIYVVQLEAFDGYWTRSNSVTIARNPAISVAVVAPEASSAYTVPTNIALEASATISSGSITQVLFYADSLLIGSDSAEPWTLEWRNVPAGSHALYAAAVSTDPNHFSLLSDPVNITVSFPTNIGQFTIAESDLEIPVSGLPIVLERNQDPRLGADGSFGKNGRLSYEAIHIEKSTTLGVGYEAESSSAHCIVPQDDRAVITVSLSATEQYYFRPRVVFQGGGDGVACVAGSSVTYLTPIRYVFDPAGTLGGELVAFDAPEGVGMMNEDALFGDWSGTIEPATEDFFEIEPYEPEWDDFVFIAPDGKEYEFDSSGNVQKITDRNGNYLAFSSGGITHSSGKAATFTRDGSNRITEIYDPIAIATSGHPALTYKYDSSGNLTNVARLVDRAGAGTYRSTGYGYEDSSFPYSITRVTDARNIVTVSNAFDDVGRLERQYDAIQNYTAFSYEEDGRRRITTDRNGAVMRQDFTDAGLLQSVQDGALGVTSFTYDSLGRVMAEENPLGEETTYGYNERDELIGETNALDYAAMSTYNGFGQPLIVIDPMGYGTTNGYDAAGNLIAVTNALAVVTRYGYDGQGNRTQETNAFGRPEQTVTSFQYDQFGNLTNLTDALGRTTSYTYNDNGNRLTETRKRTLAGGSLQTLLSTSVYDAATRIIRVIEPDGYTNHTAYNEIGLVAYRTNKNGIISRFDYDARGLSTNMVFALGTALEASEQTYYDGEGRKTNSIDRLGRSTRYTYDGVGRLTRTSYPDDTYIRNIYDAAGQLNSTAQGPNAPDPLTLPEEELVTTFLYDAAGRRTGVINALGETNSYAYDRNGNQTNFVDSLGRTNTYVFDRLNRQARTIFPDGSDELNGLDALGRRTGFTNQADVITRFAYDGLGQLLAVTNGWETGTSNWVKYAYDEVGNLTNQVDALNRSTRFDYDSMGRRIRTLLPGAQFDLSAYDPAGNLTRYTNFNAVVITNRYDALDRLTNRASIGGYSLAFTYTAAGRRETVTDVSGSYSFTYNSRDRLMSKSGPAGSLSYGYDTFGRLSSIISGRAGGASFSYAYDDLNRLSTVVDAVSGTTIYGYDEVGNLKTVAYPNDVTSTYDYSSLNRLTDILAETSGGTVATFAYQLGAAGNRTNLQESVNGTARGYAWAYDALYRLTNETVSTTAPTGTIGYRYDAVGNRLSRASTVSGISAQTLTYGANDWLTSDVYDSNGNTRTNGANVFGYDVENRLIDLNSGSITFAYDADGIRVKQSSGGTTTLYLVDDQNSTGYAQVLEELSVSGGTTNLVKAFTYGHDLIAQRIAASGARSFFGYDGNGNTRYLTDTNGAVTDTYVFDAFGTLLASSGSTDNDYLYAGEQLDSGLGLYYLRARYLNAGTGRFWSRDTFAGNNYDPVSLHKYLYASANPINYIDPSGHASFNLGSVLTTISTISILAVQQANVLVSRIGPTFAAGGRQVGLLFQQFGAVAQNAALQVIRVVQTAAPNLQLFTDQQRGGRVIDFVLQQGQRVAQIEVKYGIPRRTGEALTRLVGQIQSAITYGEGQVVIWTLREPTAQQVNLVVREVGANASRLQFVHGVEGLFQWIKLYFGL